MPPLIRPSAIDEAGDAVRQVIRAYHGSPHDFDRFDASKIGTGEGAQAYGHGLYFADNPDVAEFYRRTASAVRRTPEQDALEFIRQAHAKRGNLVGAVLDVMDRADASQAEAIANGMDEAARRWDLIRDAAARFNVHQGVPPRIGKTYEVEIGYSPRSLLDLDAPMSSQPRAVLDAFAGRGGSYRSMRDEPGDGRRLWFNLSDGSSPARAAQELREAGIPGAQYLDQQSRDIVGQGTRNYVIFPGAEDQIRILRKYGMLAPIPAAAAVGGGTED